MGSEVREVVQRSPLLYGLDRHGWALDGLRHVIPWMGRLTRASISKLLRRFQLVYKRGRAHVHSPDLEYNQKMAAIAAAREEARQAPTEVVFLYEDEFTASLRPLVGSSYRPRSERGQKATGASADKVRLAGCVDAMTGRVVWRRRSRYNVKEMYRFFYYVQEHLASMKPTSRLRFLPLPTYARFPQSHRKVLAQALSGMAALSSLCWRQEGVRARVRWLVASAL